VKGERGFLGMKGEQGNPGSAGKEDQLRNVRDIFSMNRIHDWRFCVPMRTGRCFTCLGTTTFLLISSSNGHQKLH